MAVFNTELQTKRKAEQIGEGNAAWKSQAGEHGRAPYKLSA
jgi:hypothetical protein